MIRLRSLIVLGRPWSVARTASIMGLLGLALTLATGATVAWREYAHRFEEARHEADVEAYFLADHANRLFELSVVALDAVASIVADLDWDTIASSEPLHRELRRLADSIAHIEDIWLNDEHGSLRATSFVFPAPFLDASDRENFKAAMASTSTMFVGPPIVGRLTHEATFVLSQRLETATHQFRGMVSATAYLSYFFDYWGPLTLPYDARVTLFRAGSYSILAQYPVRAVTPRDFGLSSLSAKGTYGELIGESRFGSYRRVGDVPLYVAVDISNGAVTGEWLQWMLKSLPFSVAPLLGFGLLTFLALRQARTEAAAAALLSATNAKLMAEIRSREAAEAQVRQMQKMEAIGQLTGGIAHDFNNMLAIVIGNLSLLRKRCERGETNVERFIAAAEEGAERAAALTKRLLAFARRQPLAPQTIDANQFVSDLSEMVRRTLTEQIEILTVLASGLWRTRVDPGQLENAILNLAINARDAMPQGGKLTIATSNASIDEAYAHQHPGVPPGDYVLLSVTDTGTGMSADVAAKAFDPFFSTKAAGSGTGLGLSQVYGFVRQSGGHVKLCSQIGHGTTVKMYFPRDRFSARSGEAVMAPRAGQPLAKGETILVVEDEDEVRRMSVDSLRDLGYTVLHAEGAEGALRILAETPDIRLVFTDVVMPQTNGRQLAEAALELRPGLKVLFTTGYTPDAIVHNGNLDPGLRLLGKPFTLENLARTVRDVLDAP